MQTVMKFAKLICITVSKCLLQMWSWPTEGNQLKAYNLFVKDWFCWEGLYGTGLFKTNLGTPTLSLCPCGSMFIRELILPVVSDETSIFFHCPGKSLEWKAAMSFFDLHDGHREHSYNKKQIKNNENYISEFMWSLFK